MIILKEKRTMINLKDIIYGRIYFIDKLPELFIFWQVYKQVFLVPIFFYEFPISFSIRLSCGD